MYDVNYFKKTDQILCCNVFIRNINLNSKFIWLNYSDLFFILTIGNRRF